MRYVVSLLLLHIERDWTVPSDEPWLPFYYYEKSEDHKQSLEFSCNIDPFCNFK